MLCITEKLATYAPLLISLVTISALVKQIKLNWLISPENYTQ